ncbi:MAG TPA: DUF1799 domain-containing protein [Candidatus Omnitrophota bacterium]|nr:DUF1799 domain-containing protein [Candidatus Omnitrophota bacterium]
MLGPRGGRAPSRDEVDDLVAFGAPADVIDRAKAPRQAADFAVHDDCRAVVEVFLGCDTQWRMDDGRPIGLDFTAVAVVSRALGHRLGKGLFGGLKTMEAAALKAFREIDKGGRAPRCPLMMRRR